MDRQSLDAASPADWIEGDAVRLGFEGGIACLTICRPEVRNALSPDVLLGLRQALSWPGLEGVDALVLGGSGTAFCSGADLRVLRSGIEQGEPEVVMGAMITDLHAIVTRLRTLPIPVVAAIDGPAVSAGMGLALAADLRVMGASAVMSTGHVAMGGSPDAGLSYFLAREMGRGRALAALLLSEPLTATELLAQGVVHQVVADGEVMEAAVALARRLAGIPRESFLAARRLVDMAPAHGLEDHLLAEEAEFHKICSGDNLREAVSAFFERRTPVFNISLPRTGPGT